MIDTDIIARQLLEPEQTAWRAVKQHFGDSFFLANGHLNRSRLADLVFKDDASKQWLETLLHPLIRKAWSDQVAQMKVQNERLCVVVIPLLFETGIQNQFGTTLCTACSLDTQMERLQGRDWSLEHIHSRLAAQWTLANKVEASQFIIWTDCPPQATCAQVDLILGWAN